MSLHFTDGTEKRGVSISLTLSPVKPISPYEHRTHVTEIQNDTLVSYECAAHKIINQWASANLRTGMSDWTFDARITL